MSTEEEKILNIKVKYEDAIYGILRYKEKLQELSETENKLKDDFKNGKITYDEYATTITAIGEQVKDYKGTVRELSKEVQNNIKTEKEQEGSLRSLRAQLSNATKAYDSLSEAERKGAKGQELKRHINEITDKLRGAEEETQRFYRSVGSYEESIKSALGVNNNFANSIMQMASNGKGLSGVFDGAITSAKAFGSTLMGFMTNPVFLSLAGIAGAGVAFKWFFDYNKGIEESTRLTKEFLGLTGENLKAVRSEIQATADTYGKDYKETLEAVDVLTSQYGYDTQEAIKIINDGFQSGADLNGDMIAKIKQYAPAFHDANISGKELVATIQQTRSGIFSDSGMALIQMGSKKIREMSTATAGALDAIGISSKKVQADLESGSKSTYDVIKMISTRLKELPQNSQAVGAVLKDVFGRQGANAGLKMIEQLDTMNTDLEKLKDTTGEYGEKMNEQREANEELNRVLAAMFDMSDKGFGEMLISVKTLTIQGITKLLKGVINVINYFIDLYNESKVVRAGVQAIVVNFKHLWSTVKLVFNLIIDAVKGVGRQLKGLADIVEGIVTFSFDKIKSGFNQITSSYAKTVKEGWKDIKSFAKEGAANTMDAINSVIKNKKIAHIEIPIAVAGEADKSGESVPNGKGGITTKKGKKKGKNGKTGKNNTISAKEMAKKEEAEIRKAEDLLAQLVEQTAEQRRKQIEVQYDRQIEDLRKRLATEKGLSVNAKKAITAQMVALEQIKEKKLTEFDLTVKDEAIKREQVYIQNMLASVEKGSKEEYQLKIKNIKAAYQLELDEATKQVMSEKEKNDLLASINAKYYEQEQQAYRDYHNKLQEEQTKAIENRFKAKILETQINSNGTDELGVLRLQMEEKQALLEAAQQKEGETIEAFNLRKLQLAEDYRQAKKAVNDKEVEIERGKYEAIAGMIGATQQVAEAFGEQSKGMAKASKVLALAEIAINTGVALAQGIKQAQSVPFPANIAAIATTVTTILANVVSAIKTVKSAKFASGGLVTGPGSETSDSIPAHLSNGESVLTAPATRMFAPALSAFNQIGGGVPIIGQGGNSQQIGEEFLARAVARGMAMMPRPVVSVEEINSTAGRVETIERVATIK
ncbi:hypothetical protein GCM10019997_07480 [Prevotella corporis]|uniref:phage tail tape measure protein n=1 Tax=Prevotella corporis TaxID=28128 RepID=UPI000414B024|nr:phage tail tape measure protein [Prevotella corporis]